MVSAAVVRQVLLRSGNRCAFPSCRRLLAEPDGSTAADIAHIVADAGTGPRADPGLTRAQRDSAANLLVLCPVHHRHFDSEPDRWPVHLLLDLKAQHELWVQHALDRRVDPPLPPAPHPWTERLPKQDELLSAVSGPTAIVGIWGMPGAGKSTLAAWLVHRAEPLFREGRMWVDADGSLAADDLAATLLRDLGRDAEGDPLTALAKALAGRRVLVVVDNASPDAARLAVAGADKLVLVSRRVLTPPAAATVAVGLLASAEAEDLLRARIGTVRFDAEPEAAGDVIDGCGHLALAVTLAGARLASRPKWTLAHLASRLIDEEQAVRTLDAQDRGVAAACRVSYGELGAVPAAVFRRACTLGFAVLDASTAVALLDAETGAVLADAAVEELADIGFVGDDGDGWYRLHRLVLGFGRGLPLDAGDPAPQDLRTATLGVFAAKLRDLPAEGRDTWLQRRVDNVLRLLDDVLVPSPEEWALLDAADAHLDRTAQHGRAIHLWKGAVARSGDDLREQVRRRLRLAAAFLRANRRGDALEALDRVQALSYGGSAEQHKLRGDALRGQNATLAAEEYLTALSSARDQEDPVTEARAANNYGLLLHDQGHAGLALSLFERAQEAFGRAPDPRGVASAIANQGLAQGKLGDDPTALVLARRSLSLFRDLGDLSNLAGAYNNLGIWLRRDGQLEAAVEAFGTSILLARRNDDLVTVARATMNAGRVHAARGDTELARLHYQDSLRIHGAAENELGQAHALDNLAELDATVDPENAIRAYRRAADLRAGRGADRHLALALQAAAELLDSLGRSEEAAAWRGEAEQAQASRGP